MSSSTTAGDVEEGKRRYIVRTEGEFVEPAQIEQVVLRSVRDDDSGRLGRVTVGDIAIRDADGFIKLIDRKNNVIITGGENVYPSEVEAVIGSHPGVADAAVIGLADDKWGERVTAAVVRRDGADLD